jgi:hypothetical protein
VVSLHRIGKPLDVEHRLVELERVGAVHVG